jgi:transposase
MRAPDAVAIQGALALHRTRKIRSRSALKNQIHSHLDLVFPGLSDALWNPIESKAGRIMLDEGLTPRRVRRMGPERLLRFCSTRGVRLTRLKAAEIVGAARVAFAMPETMSAVRLRILMADMELLAKLDQEISETEEQLAEILPETPADILTTLPRVSVVRASNYGEALGDITRFRHAGQVYRLSGLVPRRYESAGKVWTTTKNSREGKVELREAILELGKALRQGHPNFTR